MNKVTLSILGCGWLGHGLLKELELDYKQVKVSGRNKDKLSDLEDLGVKTFKIDLREASENWDNQFFQTRYLLIAIPPTRENNPDMLSHSQQIDKLIKKLKELNFQGTIIYCSSTSVYEQGAGVFDEKSKTAPSTIAGQEIIRAEKILYDSNINAVILRLGGLYGHQRHPIHFLAGRENLSSPEKTVNLIHIKEISIIFDRLINKLESEQIKDSGNYHIFNLVNDIDLTRKHYYTLCAKLKSLSAPSFNESEKQNDIKAGESFLRKIKNEKVKKVLDIDFNFTYLI